MAVVFLTVSSLTFADYVDRAEFVAATSVVAKLLAELLVESLVVTSVADAVAAAVAKVVFVALATNSAASAVSVPAALTVERFHTPRSNRDNQVSHRVTLTRTTRLADHVTSFATILHQSDVSLSLI